MQTVAAVATTESKDEPTMKEGKEEIPSQEQEKAVSESKQT